MGHIERSEDSSLIKRIYRGKPDGKSCVGRPRKKCMEDVEEDIKMMGIRCWRRRAQDREEWIPVVRQALALEGPLRFRERERAVSLFPIHPLWFHLTVNRVN